MTASLEIVQAGPGMSLQDQGRPGYARYGLSAGGAMDRFALEEIHALLGLQANHGAIEMSDPGGTFLLHGEARWCCTAGAAMRLTLDGRPLPWRSTFLMQPGQNLVVGKVEAGGQQGTYGYLAIAGGFDIAPEIGGIGTHLRAVIGGLDGTPLKPGDKLPLREIADDFVPDAPRVLPVPDHLGRDRIRIVWGAQSGRFREDTRDQLLTRQFALSHRRDRMAMRLDIGENEQQFEALLGGLSDPIQAGDIQMTGDGIPAILMREHQPTGGYPRIASVISADLDAAAQLPTGRQFRFELVSIDDAVALLRKRQQRVEKLSDLLRPVIRSPDQIGNLLDYNLIGGVVSASN